MNVSVFTIGRFHHFDLSRQLLARGHALRLYTSNPRAKIDADLRPFAVNRPLFRIPLALGSRMGLGGHLYWLDEILLKDLGAWLARTIDPAWTDVFHALDGAGPAAGRRIRQAGKLWICDRGSTHILTQRDILVEEHREWKIPAPQFSAHRLARCVAEYEEAHAITVPSHFARQSFLDQGIPAERVFVCPYGVELSEFSAAPKKDQVFRVLHVGQINVRKGIGYLLRAVEPLARRGRVELHLIGDIAPSFRPILDQYSGLFTCHGIVPRKELWRHYTQASVLVLASVEEGLALVQAQAMACGLPVIATANTGAADLFTDGVEGFIVPIRDPAAIREKIQWMLDNPVQLGQMSAAAVERVKTLGGWDRYGQCMDSVYQSLAARHSIQLHVTQ